MTPLLKREDFAGPTRMAGTQVCYQLCPVCGSTEWKTYMNPDTGAWYCFAGRHSAGGHVEGSWSQQCAFQRTSVKQWPAVDLPPSEAISSLTPSTMDYLRGRGLATYDYLAYGLRVAGARVLVPFRGPAGTYIYWTMRGILHCTPKYVSAPGKHPLYVLPNWQPKHTVVVVEGVFDAMMVDKHTKLPVVALCGKTLPKYLVDDLLNICTHRLVIMLDSDALGAALKMFNDLRARRQVHVVLPPPGMDPADMRGELMEALSAYIER